MKSNFLRCKNCLMVNTRPEQTLNDKQICNACENLEKKTIIVWKSRLTELKKFLKIQKKTKLVNGIA